MYWLLAALCLWESGFNCRRFDHLKVKPHVFCVRLYLATCWENILSFSGFLWFVLAACTVVWSCQLLERVGHLKTKPESKLAWNYHSPFTLLPGMGEEECCSSSANLIKLGAWLVQILSLWGVLSEEWTRISCVQCIGLCQVHILSQFLEDFNQILFAILHV